ncbi:protein pal1 [Podospora fimiseda]|uniref:Protein pal1 n=1 Tax=Podospora fimiseda TaxID=252190 RepID=A0AAN7BUD1_9PEZI|nr:protein pal1 [Podospora fimiseda]
MDNGWQRGDDYGLPLDKHWASKYILGPLTDLEPSQEFATRFTPLPPSPPDSKAPTPTRPSFFKRHSRNSSYVDEKEEEDEEEKPFLRRLLSRTSSIASLRSNQSNRSSNKNPPPFPRSPSEQKKAVFTANPPPTRWNQGTILSRSNSVATPRPNMDKMDKPHRRTSSLAERYPGDKSHRPLDILTQEHIAKNEQKSSGIPRRTGSLRERYPGDMSHRPLAMLQREHRTADRAPHLHNRRRQQPSDTIDFLDHSGPIPGATYHHGGPFDPAMKERNTNPFYSPVAAVQLTNSLAIKATPAEYIQDSLVKHVPLQGTAVIPPGMKDMSGRTMDYEEGADLMREKDAPGGAYKRWDGIKYRDDDLKGKGEPWFSQDQADKERKAKGKNMASGMAYEMQPQKSRQTGQDVGTVRKRSVSNADNAAGKSTAPEFVEGGGLRRANSTGKTGGFTQSLKKRLGSIRGRKHSGES